MIQAQTSSTIRVGIVDTIMTTGLIAAISLLPTSVYAIPETEPKVPIIRHRTPGEMVLKFRSEIDQSFRVENTLKRLVNYFVEAEQITPLEMAMTSRKRFREMYDRF